MTPEQQAAIDRARARQAAIQAARGRQQGGGLRGFLFGDNDPTTQNTGEKIGSFLNKAGEAMTFGLIGDEASAAVEGMLPGVDYETRRDHYRGQEEVLERDHPLASIGAEVGGGVLGAVAGGAGPLAAKIAGRGLLARGAASAAAGAAGGATYGFAEGEGGVDERQAAALMGGGLGAVAGGAGTAIAAGASRVANGLLTRRAIAQAARGAPSSADLRAAGQAAYREIDDAGVEVTPEAFGRAREGILGRLRAETGYDELPGPGSLTPNTARVMQIMGNASDEMTPDASAALPFRSIDQMRRQAGAAAGNVANKSDQQAGMTVIEGLDDFVAGLGPDDVTAGDVERLQEIIPKARDLWARMSRSQLVDDAIEQEGNYLSGGSSAIRNQFARILRNKKLSRGFSDAEKAAMRRVVQGTMPEQILNLLGGGLGQLGQVGIGSLGGLPGAALGMGTAALSRVASEAVTSRNAERARAAIASGLLRQGVPQIGAPTRGLLEAAARRAGVTQTQ